MTAISVPEAEEIVSQANVYDIILSERSQVFFALNIKALDIIIEVRLKQCIYIGLHRMSAGCPLSLSIFQKPLIDQRIADRGYRDIASDIVCQKQDNLTKQYRISDPLLASVFFALQNITDDYGRIDTVQQHHGLFLVKTYICNTGHTTEAHVCIKDIAQFITLAVLVIHLCSHSAEGAPAFFHFKIMEIQKLTEGQRQHLNFYTAAGKIG